MKLTIVLSILLIVALVTLGIGATHYAGNDRNTNPASGGFTLESKTIVQPTNGEPPWLNVVHTRYHKSDGNWKDVAQVYAPNGSLRSTSAMYGINDLGVFGGEVGKDSINLISPKDPMAHRLNEERMRAKPNFIGEQYIMGYRCLGQRDGSNDTWISVDLSLPFRSVHTSSSAVETTEVTKITYGEPDFDAVLPTCNVKFETFESLIQSQGKSSAAQEMKQFEDTLKAKLVLAQICKK